MEKSRPHEKDFLSSRIMKLGKALPNTASLSPWQTVRENRVFLRQNEVYPGAPRDSLPLAVDSKSSQTSLCYARSKTRFSRFGILSLCALLIPSSRDWESFDRWPLLEELWPKAASIWRVNFGPQRYLGPIGLRIQWRPPEQGFRPKVASERV